MGNQDRWVIINFSLCEQSPGSCRRTIQSVQAFCARGRGSNRLINIAFYGSQIVYTIECNVSIRTIEGWYTTGKAGQTSRASFTRCIRVFPGQAIRGCTVITCRQSIQRNQVVRDEITGVSTKDPEVACRRISGTTRGLSKRGE